MGKTEASGYFVSPPACAIPTKCVINGGSEVGMLRFILAVILPIFCWLRGANSASLEISSQLAVRTPSCISRLDLNEFKKILRFNTPS